MYKIMLILIIAMLSTTVYIYKQLDTKVSKARIAHSSELAQLDIDYNIQ